ncbi:MAG: hypothetical protein AAF805_04965 [Planctomycetota bacterium]
MKSVVRQAAATLLAAVLLAPVSANAQTSQEPTLRDRLVAGLQVRRPSEFAFIDSVVDTVDRGELPERLVDRFFFWSRNRVYRSSRVRRAIIYFQPGLERQARRLGIAIAANPS